MTLIKTTLYICHTMIKTVVLTILALSGYFLNAQNLGDLTFGTDSTFEVITWNIERFPKNGQTTVNYVTNIIEALDVDIVAVQEIDSKSRFEQLVEQLDGWDGYYVDAERSGLGYIFKPDVIEVLDTFQIYKTFRREFPRSPFVMEIKYNGEKYILINNHFKCCGDGDLESGDVWDEETRRFHASSLLESYVNSNYPDDNVILLGDLNDVITDPPADNVFKAFLDAPGKYVFVDMEIAQGTPSNWSFPNWPSQIDHILVTDEMFAALENDASEVLTIKIDEYLDGGYPEYDQNVSDHRPVALKIDVGSDVVSVGELDDDRNNLTVYPNPFKQSTTIAFDHSYSGAEIDIFNAVGKQVYNFTANSAESSITWDATGLPSGIYYVVLRAKREVKSIAKVILTD